MKILSVRESAGALDRFIAYFIRHWSNPKSESVYDDCIRSCMGSDSPLPQWYLLEDDAGGIVGGVGLITNDFISRMDLQPWLCALYVEEPHRGRGFGGLLVRHVIGEAHRLGFDHLYLCTDHVGYYERYGFSHIGMGYHPWGESSRIYQIETGKFSDLPSVS